jgi:phosphatidylserine decarboxylase
VQDEETLIITRYGYDVVITVLVIVVIGSLLALYLIEPRFPRYSVAALLLGCLLFTLYFFRDPDRVTPAGDGLVIAPADGKVIQVIEVREDEYLKADAVQISIFMSPLNVHVNRHPISGKVGYVKHHPGEFLVAFDDKASLRNERTHIGVENARMRVLFKQIAGFVARRIVAEVREGDPAVAGERFGMIKFGSRVDVILPRTVRVLVTPGQVAVAGETILATAS